MFRRIVIIATAFTLSAGIGLSNAPKSYAGKNMHPNAAGSPYDLIDAVNVLRASHGLAPYSISSILMYTAQSQADFMAVTGTMSHAGPGGIGLTARLLAAGYPLAGELSAGGFCAENITGGNESMPAEAAVEQWSGDALHLDTMISVNLTEIGAGVAVSAGRVYYVIDAARPTTSGIPQESASVAGSRSTDPARAAPISAAVVSAANSNGDIIHEVQLGESLWQLAIAYNVKIEEIKGLNNLFDDNIYPGSKLLIKRGLATPATAFTEPPTGTGPTKLSVTASPVSTATRAISTATRIVAPDSSSTNTGAIIGVMIGIIALALLGGGLLTWLGRSG